MCIVLFVQIISAGSSIFRFSQQRETQDEKHKGVRVHNMFVSDVCF